MEIFTKPVKYACLGVGSFTLISMLSEDMNFGRGIINACEWAVDKADDILYDLRKDDLVENTYFMPSNYQN